MSLHEKILKVENKIIDFLTMLCWWSEVRFDISNLGWYSRVNILGLLVWIAGFLLVCLVAFTDQRYFLFSICVLFQLFLVLDFFMSVLFPVEKIEAILEKFPQGFPNPSRFLKYKERRFFFSLTLYQVLWLLLVTESSVDVISSVFLILALLISTLECFLLSCDEMPPAEKARRRAAREMTHVSPVLT